jgi:hypothetical protein
MMMKASLLRLLLAAYSAASCAGFLPSPHLEQAWHFGRVRRLCHRIFEQAKEVVCSLSDSIPFSKNESESRKSAPHDS